MNKFTAIGILAEAQHGKDIVIYTGSPALTIDMIMRRAMLVGVQASASTTTGEIVIPRQGRISVRHDIESLRGLSADYVFVDEYVAFDEIVGLGLESVVMGRNGEVVRA